MILQARCEVTDDSICSPVNAAMSPDYSALVLLSAGGWKNRDPVLSLYLLDDGTAGHEEDDDEEESIETITYDEYRCVTIEPGFASVAYQATTDADRKLAVVADDARIKTFYYGREGQVQFGDWAPARGKNVHTMKSSGYDGPIALLPGGRVARAGQGGIAFWDLAALETHAGGRRVGRGRLSTEDSWRDNDGEEIERSTGSAPTTTVRFAQGAEHIVPAGWQYHAPTGLMLAGDNAQKNKGHYGFYALDLEHGAKKVKRFLGHGATVSSVCVSEGDANAFVTACTDGYARLFDVRHPLPGMTFDQGKSGEFCETAEFVHADGIPSMSLILSFSSLALTHICCSHLHRRTTVAEH